MKKQTYSYLLILFLTSCLSSGKQTDIAISKYKFNGTLGVANTDQHLVSIMTKGFLMKPVSINIDSVISNWIAKHPSSVIQPLIQSSDLTFVLVSSKTDTLNTFLVKSGCLPASSMYLSSVDTVLSNNKLVHDTIISVYEKKLDAAEVYAKENKKGIWADNCKQLEWRKRISNLTN